jgi:hypothetical protein
VHILSAIIALLAMVASASGLFIHDLYRDNPLVTSAFKGNDLVTLVIAVPTLIVAMILAMRGSRRAHLVWIGMLVFTLYNYAFYLFGAAFNRLFWVYDALFALSIYALIYGISQLDADDISQGFGAKTPVKWISGFMLFFAMFLGGMWVARSLSFFVTGQVPQDIIQTGHPTGVVYAIDLALLVPGLVLGGLWLWQRRPWGYVLGAVMMIKATTYALALIAMSAFSDRAGIPGAWELAPLWVFLGAGCLVSCGSLLGNMRSGEE